MCASSALGRAAPTCICWGDGCAECPCCVATSMQRPRRARCPPMVDETLPQSPCLQHADEGHTVVDVLGRTSYTSRPKGPPRDFGTPLSRRPNSPCPGRGFLLGARGRPANRPGLLFSRRWAESAVAAGLRPPWHPGNYPPTAARERPAVGSISDSGTQIVGRQTIATIFATQLPGTRRDEAA